MTTKAYNNPTLHHLLKTIQYRINKVFDGAPEQFGDVSVGHGAMTACETLAHVSDVLSFIIRHFDAGWSSPEGGGWDAEVERFRATLTVLDSTFRDHSIGDDVVLRLIQGPLADSLTHIGQLATLRRVAGAPVAGENFFIAELPEVSD